MFPFLWRGISSVGALEEHKVKDNTPHTHTFFPSLLHFKLLKAHKSIQFDMFAVITLVSTLLSLTSRASAVPLSPITIPATLPTNVFTRDFDPIRAEVEHNAIFDKYRRDGAVPLKRSGSVVKNVELSGRRERRKKRSTSSVALTNIVDGDQTTVVSFSS